MCVYQRTFRRVNGWKGQRELSGRRKGRRLGIYTHFLHLSLPAAGKDRAELPLSNESAIDHVTEFDKGNGGRSERKPRAEPISPGPHHSFPGLS